MISRVYTGMLTHIRSEPIAHAFRYSTYMLGLDVGELERLSSSVPLFGYNRVRLCSIWDRDYIDPEPGSISDKLRRHLDRAGCGQYVETVYLLTMPRVLQVGFNPLSLFWCFDGAGKTQAVIAEVRNTYKEAHLYVLHEPHFVADRQNANLHYRFPKELFVSPFNGVEGEYDLRLSAPGDYLSVEIDLVQSGKPIIRARLRLRGVPFNNRTLVSTLARYPLTAALVLPRIAFRALILQIAKGLKPRMKPEPTSDMTVRRADSASHISRSTQ
jgi:DUF1365 family protein